MLALVELCGLVLPYSADFDESFLGKGIPSTRADHEANIQPWLNPFDQLSSVCRSVTICS